MIVGVSFLFSDSATDDHRGSKIGDTTHFGYRTVATGEKAKLVGEVFHRVASKYDLMNVRREIQHVFSCALALAGSDEWWRASRVERAVRFDAEPAAWHEVAGCRWWHRSARGGSRSLVVRRVPGDIAFRFLSAAAEKMPIPALSTPTPVKRTPCCASLQEYVVDFVYAAASVIVCDINPSMLSVGRDRAVARGFAVSSADVFGMYVIVLFIAPRFTFHLMFVRFTADPNANSQIQFVKGDAQALPFERSAVLPFSCSCAM